MEVLMLASITLCVWQCSKYTLWHRTVKEWVYIETSPPFKKLKTKKIYPFLLFSSTGVESCSCSVESRWVCIAFMYEVWVWRVYMHIQITALRGRGGTAGWAPFLLLSQLLQNFLPLEILWINNFLASPPSSPAHTQHTHSTKHWQLVIWKRRAQRFTKH